MQAGAATLREMAVQVCGRCLFFVGLPRAAAGLCTPKQGRRRCRKWLCMRRLVPLVWFDLQAHASAVTVHAPVPTPQTCTREEAAAAKESLLERLRAKGNLSEEDMALMLTPQASCVLHRCIRGRARGRMQREQEEGCALSEMCASRAQAGGEPSKGSDATPPACLLPFRVLGHLGQPASLIHAQGRHFSFFPSFFFSCRSWPRRAGSWRRRLRSTSAPQAAPCRSCRCGVNWLAYTALHVRLEGWVGLGCTGRCGLNALAWDAPHVRFGWAGL